MENHGVGRFFADCRIILGEEHWVNGSTWGEVRTNYRFRRRGFPGEPLIHTRRV